MAATTAAAMTSPHLLRVVHLSCRHRDADRGDAIGGTCTGGFKTDIRIATSQPDGTSVDLMVGTAKSPPAPSRAPR